MSLSGVLFINSDLRSRFFPAVGVFWCVVAVVEGNIRSNLSIVGSSNTLQVVQRLCQKSLTSSSCQPSLSSLCPPRNTVRCRRHVHHCWCVARWLPCCHCVRLSLILIVVVNVSLVAVVVVNVLARRCRVRRHRCLSPSRSLLSLLLMRLLIAIVFANAVSLAAAIALLSRQCSFTCRDAFEVKMQRLYKSENNSVVTSKMNEQ